MRCQSNSKNSVSTCYNRFVSTVTETSYRERGDPDFALKRRNFFVRLGLQVRDALKLHDEMGLWNRADYWGNVSEHCLVEVARVQVFVKKHQE